jgi:probable addiction module antidote protein
MAKAQLENEIMTLKKSDIASHLNATIKGGDASAFPAALGNAVRGFGIEELSDATGYTRQQIRHATLPEAKPSFMTVHKLARGMNLAIRLVPTENG